MSEKTNTETLRRILILIRDIKRRESRIRIRTPPNFLYGFLLPSGSRIVNGTVFKDGKCLGTVHEVVNKKLGGI